MEQDNNGVRDKLDDSIDEIQLNNDIKIVSILEDFTGNPEFTDSINEFMYENANKIEESKNGEHSLK